MPRITRVKKAQPRYRTVPVLDENGVQKQTPMMKDGVQMTTKHGKPIFLKLTVADRTQPLPNERCGKCGTEILPGQPYKHMSPKSGPYGGRRLVRCASCPDWQYWEYSNSLSARIAQAVYDAEQALSGVTDQSDLESARDDAAQAIRDIAEEQREKAGNIEDGFGHSTSMSEELEEQADELDSWADEIEGVYPDDDEPTQCSECEGSGQVDCEDCGGDGATDEGDDCPSCEGERTTECGDCAGTGEASDGAKDEWADAFRDSIIEALGNSPF